MITSTIRITTRNRLKLVPFSTVLLATTFSCVATNDLELETDWLIEPTLQGSEGEGGIYLLFLIQLFAYGHGELRDSVWFCEPVGAHTLGCRCLVALRVAADNNGLLSGIEVMDGFASLQAVEVCLHNHIKQD